jgi:TfoX/Sxy family transcriptional regulator of competence genes
MAKASVMASAVAYENGVMANNQCQWRNGMKICNSVREKRNENGRNESVSAAKYLAKA